MGLVYCGTCNVQYDDNERFADCPHEGEGDFIRDGFSYADHPDSYPKQDDDESGSGDAAEATEAN